MKNKGLYVLVTITFLFIGFAAGVFVGRNFNSGPVLLSSLPQDTTAGTNVSLFPTDPNPGSNTAPTAANKIDINTATVLELSTLPGIGEVIAQRIVDYREVHGEFDSLADLMNVEGIGQKRLEQIIEYITLGG